MESNAIKVLGFALGEQWFGLDLSMVKEVVEWSDLASVPKAPGCALGIFNYHGRIITVVDPAHFFNLTPKRVSPDTRIIILSGEEYSLGLRVDHAEKIESFPRDMLLTGREGKVEKNFIKAVVPIEDKLYNLLDPEPLLDSIEEEFSAANER
jgi:purine-binding chemotaxis protein CheW